MSVDQAVDQLCEVLEAKVAQVLRGVVCSPEEGEELRTRYRQALRDNIHQGLVSVFLPASATPGAAADLAPASVEVVSCLLPRMLCQVTAEDLEAEYEAMAGVVSRRKRCHCPLSSLFLCQVPSQGLRHPRLHPRHQQEDAAGTEGGRGSRRAGGGAGAGGHRC